jgi:hypothetical protein
MFIQPEKPSGPLLSRISDDIFHVQNRLLRQLSRTHSGYKAFARAFSEVLLVRDASDEAAVKAVLARKNVSWQVAQRARPDALRKRIRRFCPPPEQLDQDLERLFESWANVKCTKDPKGKVLFNSAAHDEATKIRRAARQGYLSDPPGLQLYHQIGVDPDGLPVYRCIRGTNSIEGGIHMPLRRTFGPLHASPELADSILALIRHRRNTTVSQQSTL